jgi:hypothetical protein
MSDPSAPLQKAIVAALRASSDLATLMRGSVQIFDRIPDAPKFPYLHMAGLQVLDDGNSCEVWGAEVFLTLHIWSREFGKVEAERIGDLIGPLLAVPLSVEGWVCINGTREDANYFFDGDGVTARGVLTFRYLVQPF